MTLVSWPGLRLSGPLIYCPVNLQKANQPNANKKIDEKHLLATAFDIITFGEMSEHDEKLFNGSFKVPGLAVLILKGKWLRFQFLWDLSHLLIGRPVDSATQGHWSTYKPTMQILLTTFYTP